VISNGFLGFLLIVSRLPYSVPIRNLLGPLSALYSQTVPPTGFSNLFSPSVKYSVRLMESVGPSLNFLVSQNNTVPSVEVVTNSVPVLEFYHNK